MEKFPMKFVSTQIKVLLFLSFMGILFASSNLYSIYHGTRCENQFDRVLTKYYTINQFMTLFSENPVLFEAYMADKTEQNWINFINNNNKVRHVLGQMIQEADGMSLESYLLIQSIKNTYVNFDMIARNPTGASYEVRQIIDVRQSSSQILEYTRMLLEESLTFGTEIHYDMQNSMRAEHRISMLLLSLAAGASVLFLFYVKRQVLNPLTALSLAVNEITRENFDTEDLPANRQDEIGQLNRAVNQMKAVLKNVIQELKEKQILTHKVYSQELRIINSEKMLEKARFSLLQSQINPHFLFNTLNVIAGAATKENAGTTYELITHLSRFFRYTLENKEEVVTLFQELSVLKSFIYIQKKRFGDRLDYQLNAAVETNQYYIPPFTLQPLVENSIKHGILVKEHGGRVKLRIYENADELILRILDNGAGMSKNDIQRLNARIPSSQDNAASLSDKQRREPSLQSDTRSGTGLGAGNVFERLKLIYPQCKIKVYSKEAIGTCIEIKILLEDCKHA
ncbi:MAG: histidine kinase [Lachnospiraceae bacterium]|nr:histidine kinase [Lachnospiraceae bacterium]